MPKPTGPKTATAPKLPRHPGLEPPAPRRGKKQTVLLHPMYSHSKAMGLQSPAKFKTGFLNQGLERLVFLFEDACGLNTMLESKMKKVKATIADQAAIDTAKSEHYEAKYKTMVQEHQSTLQKITHEAQAKSNTAQVQHEQDMASYRESLKNSVAISLLQARLKNVL
ncbi:hypothetical protein Hanom_Chr16g01460361 [Helianthus anomalus]